VSACRKARGRETVDENTDGTEAIDDAITAAIDHHQIVDHADVLDAIGDEAFGPAIVAARVVGTRKRGREEGFEEGLTHAGEGFMLALQVKEVTVEVPPD
jgi:hypothetical protein